MSGVEWLDEAEGGESEFGPPQRHVVLVQTDGDTAVLGPFAARNVARRVGYEIATAVTEVTRAAEVGPAMIAVSVLPVVSGRFLARYKADLRAALTAPPTDP